MGRVKAQRTGPDSLVDGGAEGMKTDAVIVTKLFLKIPLDSNCKHGDD